MHTTAHLISGNLKGINRLKISESLTTFPEEVLELAETLEILDLTGNRLSALPEVFRQLKNLKILFLSENDFTEFPEVLGALPKLEMVGFKANKIASVPPNAFPPNLRWLILTDNEIGELPASIGNCQKLQKLMLAGNKLTQLPPELANCRNLELLRISANNLTQLPDWLFSLHKITWLAFAGNPLTFRADLQTTLPEISWPELEIKEKLGEGASGIISKAILKKDPETGLPAEVAVKIFRGQVTSDGLPADEMAACLAAGAHPNIVQVLGKIKDHPQQSQGLVLKLIPPVYHILGNPPTFETCTRDTFPNGTVLSLKRALTIAMGMASALNHLHRRGILHGDLYAHNILIDDQPNPLLSDFGAATIFNITDKKLADQLEKLEIRAFGILLDDLLNLTVPAELNNPLVMKLTDLKKDCLQENPESRPGSAQVYTRLRKIEASLLQSLP